MGTHTMRKNRIILFDKDERTKAISMLLTKGDGIEGIYREADDIRKQNMGDEVYIRGIIEFSSICANDCLYCGIRASNMSVNRYAMNADEILDIARTMESVQQTTVVLQSGETPGINDDEIGAIIRRIKHETNLAVTLSVGNRPYKTYKYWRDCGMDRYLLRFETSDSDLFERLHPDCSLDERLECLYALKKLGIQTGSGFMIGLPGETIDILADNILLCRKLDLDMIGIGPFIPHPDTPLGREKNAYEGDEGMFFKALSVLRIFNPDAHIPATTAFDAVFPGVGRNLALQRGANIFMPNNTPVELRKDYILYPGKPCVDESIEQYARSVLMRIESIGRTTGKGHGHSIKRNRDIK